MPNVKQLATTTWILALLSCLSINVNGQIHDALILVMDKPGTDILEVIQYPPGTEYKVLDTEGNQVRLYEKVKHILSYEGDFVLEVRPDYKPGADRYEKTDLRLRITHSNEGAIAIDLPSLYKRLWHHKPEHDLTKKYDYGQYTGDVTLTKKLIPSNKIPNTFNVEARFSNGIEFSYTDGKAEASLDGKELEIEGKFIIKSELGLAKLSFNPHNGVVWYVFEPHRTAQSH